MAHLSDLSTYHRTVPVALSTGPGPIISFAAKRDTDFSPTVITSGIRPVKVDRREIALDECAREADISESEKTQPP
jgi:hypothetical protein